MQELVYPTQPGICNWASLPKNAVTFYRWLFNWHKQTGEIWASTDYLARRSKRSERTVYRWLASLEDLGAIAREVDEGIERRITPLFSPPEKTAKLTRRSNRGGASGRGAGRRLYSNNVYKNGRGNFSPTDNFCHPPTLDVSVTLETTTSTIPLPDTKALPNDQVSAKLTDELILQGVAEPVAKKLVRDDAQMVEKQLKAIRYRSAMNKAGALVASIKQRWSVPVQADLDSKREQKCLEMARNRAERALESKKRVDMQESACRLYEGLPEQEKAHLLELARQRIYAESPGAYQVISRSASFDTVLRSRAIQIAASGC